MTDTSETRARFALWAFIAWLAVTLMWWALAFAPLPLPAELLATARSVCFGSSPDGLPEPWGWAGLIVSPLAMLAFLLGVWGRDLGTQFRELAGRPLGRAVLAGFLVVPMLGAGWVISRVDAARRSAAALELSTLPAELPAEYPRRREPAPPLGLVDQHGEIVSLASLAGRPVLMTFAFAHCQTVCPVMVETLKQAAAEIPELEPALVVVTLDPWRDTPSALPSLYASWHLEDQSRAHVLSGEVEQVLATLDAWNMPWERDDKTGDVSHPAMVHVLAPDGTMGYSFNGPTAAWVAEAARRVMAAPAEGSPAL
jgi:protein SCO1/2